jgi:hypothetical protein
MVRSAAPRSSQARQAKSRQETLGNRQGAAVGAGEAVFSAELDGVRLTLRLDARDDQRIIRQASLSGARTAEENSVLETLCAIVVGRPLQEAADHGVIYIAAQSPLAAKVAGIRTPQNAGPIFAFAQRLIRNVFAAANAQSQVAYQENRWYVSADANWLAKSEAEQASILKPVVARFLHAKGQSEDDLWISRIERGTRVTVAFGASVHYAAKPRLLMDLERRLRAETGEPLELFMEEMKDANRIRRL